MGQYLQQLLKTLPSRKYSTASYAKNTEYAAVKTLFLSLPPPQFVITQVISAIFITVVIFTQIQCMAIDRSRSRTEIVVILVRLLLPFSVNYSTISVI